MAWTGQLGGRTQVDLSPWGSGTQPPWSKHLASCDTDLPRLSPTLLNLSDHSLSSSCPILPARVLSSAGCPGLLLPETPRTLGHPYHPKVLVPPNAEVPQAQRPCFQPLTREDPSQVRNPQLHPRSELTSRLGPQAPPLCPKRKCPPLSSTASHWRVPRRGVRRCPACRPAGVSAAG